MLKNLTITLVEERVTCPKLSLKTDTVYLDNKVAYKVHRCEYSDFCNAVLKNWEKYHKAERETDG